MVIHRTICAWCGKTILEGDPHAAPSHGICPECVIKVEGEDPVRAANHFAGWMVLAFILVIIAALCADDA